MKSTASTILRHFAAPPEMRVPVRLTVAAAVGSFTFVGLVLGAQVFFSPVMEPMGEVAALTIAVIATLLIALCRIALLGSFHASERTSTLFRVGMLLPGIPLLLLGISLSLGISMPWLLLIWLIFLAEEITLLRLAFRLEGSPSGTTPVCPQKATRITAETDLQVQVAPPVASASMAKGQPSEAPEASDILATATHHEPSVPDFEQYVETLDPMALPTHIDRTFTRARTSDNGELLFGWVRGHFVSQQRTLTLHVEFCPPFTVSPEIQIKQIEGLASLDIQFRCQPFGIRIDARRSGATTSPDAVLVALMAECKDNSLSKKNDK